MSPRGQQQNEKMRTEAMEKITNAALTIFADYGYHAATMEQIRQVSGLSKGLVYHYFPSKEGIFFHLIETALEISKNAWVEALNTPGTAWQKINKLSEILFHVTFTDENSLYFLVMLQAFTQGKGISGLSEYFMEHGAHFDLLPPLIGEAQKSGEAMQGDPDVLASTYIAAFLGYTLLLLQDKNLQKKITPDTFTDVLRSRRDA